MNISPLNFTELLARLRMPPADPKKRVEEVRMYRCLECDEVHEEEMDARACCAEPTDTDTGPYCPVCGTKCHDHEAASDCCLWKDLDATTRHRIAAAVEAGSTWADQLQVHPLLINHNHQKARQ